jgi:hypothetical protein
MKFVTPQWMHLEYVYPLVSLSQKNCYLFQFLLRDMNQSFRMTVKKYATKTWAAVVRRCASHQTTTGFLDLRHTAAGTNNVRFSTQSLISMKKWINHAETREHRDEAASRSWISCTVDRYARHISEHIPLGNNTLLFLAEFLFVTFSVFKF